jgi:hypothetical protein
MLVVCVFASALGGLIICLLVLRDAFSPTSAVSSRTEHDVQITKVGYAIAGACFVMTALLATILVARTPLRPVAATSDARVTERLTALDRERAALAEQISALGATVQTLREQVGTVDGGVQGMRTRLDQTESRVARAESGLTTAEAALKRLGDEMTQANARARQIERSAATKPIVVGPREIVVPAAPAAPPTPQPQRRTELERPHESAPPSSPSAAVASTPAPAPVTQAASPPPAASLAPKPAPAPKQAATAKPAPSAAASAPQDAPPTNLTDKVRNDWNVIRRGFSSAGDDFSAAMRELGRRATGRD